MFLSDRMQGSINYNRNLMRGNKYYKRDKALIPKWGNDLKVELNDAPKHQQLANRNRNKDYVEEMREKNKKGLLVAVSIVAFIVILVVRWLF